MDKKQMLECLQKNDGQIKVWSFMVRMNALTKKKQEETRKRLESLKFKDEDDFIRWIRFNVSSVV